jgi:hypothetical protein
MTERGREPTHASDEGGLHGVPCQEEEEEQQPSVAGSDVAQSAPPQQLEPRAQSAPPPQQLEPRHPVSYSQQVGGSVNKSGSLKSGGSRARSTAHKGTGREEGQRETEPTSPESRHNVSFSQQVGKSSNKSSSLKSGGHRASSTAHEITGREKRRRERTESHDQTSRTESDAEVALESRHNVSFSQQMGPGGSPLSNLKSGHARTANRSRRHAERGTAEPLEGENEQKSPDSPSAPVASDTNAARSGERGGVYSSQRVGRNMEKGSIEQTGALTPGAFSVRPHARSEDQSRRSRLAGSRHRSSERSSQNDILIQGRLVDERTPSTGLASDESPRSVTPRADGIPVSIPNAVVEVVDARIISDDGGNEAGDRRVTRRRYLICSAVTVILLGMIGLIVGLTQRPANDFSIESFVKLYLPQYSQQAILADPESPQAIAITFLSKDPKISTYTNTERLTRFSLATFYYALSDPDRREWDNSTGWVTYTEECSWFASSNSKSVCSADGRFIALTLEENSLSGSLPLELELLSDLQEIRLRENFITGVLPSEIGSLELLSVLDLAGNHLEGKIPLALGNNRMMVHLDLWDNVFYGTIPPSLFSHNVGETSRAGANSDTLQDDLEPRYMQQNGSDLRSLLEVVNLGNNLISGTIPSSIGMALNLRKLDLSTNRIQGAVPAIMSKLTLLSHFGMLLWMLSLFIVKLNFLTLFSLYRCSRVSYVDIRDNAFTGTLDSLLFTFVPSATYIDVGANYELFGTLPPGISRFENISHLGLDRIYLVGTIPTEIGLLAGLETLYLSDTYLAGSIPSEMYVFIAIFSFRLALLTY